MPTEGLAEQLGHCAEAAARHRAQLQVVGRALTPAEQRQVELIEAVVEPLRALIAALQDDQEPDAEPPRPPLRDGRYAGGNDELFVDLRVDEKVAGVVSADLFRNGAGGRQYVASLRTAPGTRIDASEGSWPIAAEDQLGARATGRLSLAPADGHEDQLIGSITLDGRLNGLASRREMPFTATWSAPTLRTVGIELETERDVSPIAPFKLNGRPVTLESCFTDAGLAVVPVGRPDPVPRKPQGWGTGQLHTLMADCAQAPLSRRAWELHLLLLSRATREGLLGVMFDTTAVLPRQGAAVFADAIRDLTDVDTVRKLIQTSAHELGHALNLAHRFERSVGRADSTSFMNYDWRYGGGGRKAEFWSRFGFTFDPDELEFLRHAPLGAVIPGGAAFHSVDYWIQGEGGYSPYVPEVSLPGFDLELLPPQRGALFRFGQPVFLEVVLTNRTGGPVDLPKSILDAKTGLLEILVKRVAGGTGGGLVDAEPFVPIMQRCYDLDPRLEDRVPDGQSIRNNVHITYGSGGFAFAEPGAYEITALVVVFDEPNERELIIRSPPLRIRVAHPQGADDERDAMDLFDDEVGTYLALGGTAALPRAKERLDEIRKRRGDVADPLVAAIVRAEAIDAGRWYVRFKDDEFWEVDADPEAAAELLGSLDDDAMQAFDAFTASETRDLRAEHRKAAGRPEERRPKRRAQARKAARR